MVFKQINSTNFTGNVCLVEDKLYIPYLYKNENVCLVEDKYCEKYNRRDNLIIFYFIHLVMYYITIGLTLLYILKLFNKYVLQKYLEDATKNIYRDFNIHNKDDYYDDKEASQLKFFGKREYINDKYGENQVKMEMNENETNVYLQDENDNYNLIITKDIGTNTSKDDIIPNWCDSSDEYFRCRLEKLLEDTRIAIPIDSFCSIYGDISKNIPNDELFLELDKDTVSNVTIISILKDICCKRGWDNKFLITDDNY
jgi:hypothetical protein